MRDSLSRAIREKNWTRAEEIVNANRDLFTLADLPSDCKGVQSQNRRDKTDREPQVNPEA